MEGLGLRESFVLAISVQKGGRGVVGLIHIENASTEGGALAPGVIRINNLGTEGGAGDVGLIHLYRLGGTVPPPPAKIPLDQVDVTWGAFH